MDPDGLIRGYYFSFDSLTWTFTTRNDSLFSLKLNSPDTTYTFYVSSVDNGGNGHYDPSGIHGAEPFTDLNSNQQWDQAEPFVDLGTIDPTPAKLAYPIQNTPPTVAFILKSDVPETTYSIATFQWTGSDLDGNETITNYYFAIDDTVAASSWKALPGSSNRVTLLKSDGLSQGRHVFYLRAKDVSGSFSKIIQMPDTSKVWYVREPKGDFLIVDDYSPSDAATSFYASMFDTLLGSRLNNDDILDIKIGSTATSRGKYVPALVNPTLTETFKLFKYIFWYADNAPSLEIAQATLPEFKRAGGKVLFVSGFPEGVTGQGSLVEFAPIENVAPSFFATRLNARDTLFQVEDNSYPILRRDTLGAVYTFPREIIPNAGARVLYRMQPSTRWVGQPIMGVKDADQPKFVLLAILLHRFGANPPSAVAALLRKVYRDEFGVQ